MHNKVKTENVTPKSNKTITTHNKSTLKESKTKTTDHEAKIDSSIKDSIVSNRGNINKMIKECFKGDDMNNDIKDNTSTNSNKTFNSKYSTPKFQSNGKSIAKSRDNSKTKIKEPKKMITPTNAKNFDREKSSLQYMKTEEEKQPIKFTGTIEDRLKADINKFRELKSSDSSFTFTEKLLEIFYSLDSDNDGLISSSKINLSRNF